MKTKIKYINKTIRKSNLPLVIGYFSCVHKMHEQLFKKYKKFNILTFNTFSSKKNSYIYDFETRICNLKYYNPQKIFIFDINKNNWTAVDFVNKVLMKIKPSIIIVGSDFVFGCDNRDVNFLCKYFKIDVVEHNNKYSSKLISSLLKFGKINEANKLLSNNYFYISNWIKGARNGKKINYPTINLNIKKKIIIPCGSYITRTKIASKLYNSVTFLGKTNLFKNSIFTLETHIIDKHICNRCLYPYWIKKRIKIIFYEWIRQNKNFKDCNSLFLAIKNDIKIAKDYFITKFYNLS